MPRFKSLDNIINCNGEIFDPAWLQGDHIVVPSWPEWTESRDIQVEDVLVWEVCVEYSGRDGIYAAWNPHAEFYIHVQGGQVIETFRGAHAKADVEHAIRTHAKIMHAPVRNKHHLHNHPKLRHSEHLPWHKADNPEIHFSENFITSPLIPSELPSNINPAPEIVSPLAGTPNEPREPFDSTPVTYDPATGQMVPGTTIIPGHEPEAPTLHWPMPGTTAS
jgi:hypothetical protein